MLSHLIGANARIVAVKAGTATPQIHAGYMVKQDNPKYNTGLNQPRFIDTPKTFCHSHAEPAIVVATDGKFEVTCKRCQAKLLDDIAYNTETRNYSIPEAIQNYRKPIGELIKKKPKRVV